MKSSAVVRTLVATFFGLSSSTSFAALVNVQTKVLELWPREWGFHIVIEPAAAASLVNLGVACDQPTYPLWLLTKPDYKTTRDALFLAYTLKKTIRIHVETTPPAGVPLCYSGHYPTMYAVDVFEN